MAHVACAFRRGDQQKRKKHQIDKKDNTLNEEQEAYTNWGSSPKPRPARSGRAPSALSAPTVTLTASVQSQACQGGDNVNVTLTATLQPPQSNVRYTWDFNNDGIFDTAPSPNPTVTHRYPDEANVTAAVKVTKGTRSATDSITFSTVRCGG